VPPVSIITATYNAAPFIARTIACVLAQTWTDFEWIIVDDESSDGTPDLLEAVDDDRLKVLRRPNGGPSAARNTGLARATGALVALLDHDDVWFPDRLGKLAARVGSDEFLGMASSNMFIGDPDHPTGAHTILDNPDCRGLGLDDHRTWLRGCSFSASTALIRREALDRHGGWREDLWYAQDWELVLRLWRGGERAAMLGEPLGWTVMREGQLSEGHDGTFSDRESVLKSVIAHAGASVADSAAELLREWERDEAKRRLGEAMAVAGNQPARARALARWAGSRTLPPLDRAVARGYAEVPGMMDALRRFLGRG